MINATILKQSEDEAAGEEKLGVKSVIIFVVVSIPRNDRSFMLRQS